MGKTSSALGEKMEFEELSCAALLKPAQIWCKDHSSALEQLPHRCALERLQNPLCFRAGPVRHSVSSPFYVGSYRAAAPLHCCLGFRRSRPPRCRDSHNGSVRRAPYRIPAVPHPGRNKTIAKAKNPRRTQLLFTTGQQAVCFLEDNMTKQENA